MGLVKITEDIQKIEKNIVKSTLYIVSLTQDVSLDRTFEYTTKSRLVNYRQNALAMARCSTVEKLYVKGIGCFAGKYETLLV